MNQDKQEQMIADIMDGGQKDMYNMGIDASIELVSKYHNATSQPFLKSLTKEIIDKLKALKK